MAEGIVRSVEDLPDCILDVTTVVGKFEATVVAFAVQDSPIVLSSEKSSQITGTSVWPFTVA